MTEKTKSGFSSEYAVALVVDSIFLQSPHPLQAWGAVLSSELDIQVAAAVALSLALRLLCGFFFMLCYSASTSGL